MHVSPPPRPLALLLTAFLLLGLAVRGSSSPASAMPDHVVRAPAQTGAGGVLAAPARVRLLPLAPTETPGEGVWPLDPAPEVVRGFDPPEAAYGAGHRGVDLRGHVGQQVLTALAGVVTYAGRLAGRGVLVVSHGATRTTYEPVAASVHRGQQVATGAVLGTLEWSGSHCLPVACLHWGLRRGDDYLDPLTLVGRGPRPVRLYPW